MSNLTWTSLTLSKPKLKKLLETAKELKSVRSRRPHFCANSYWLTTYQPIIKALVGNDSGAYKLASEKVYKALPDCKDCFCKTVGITPKNSRMLLIKQLFDKLTETHNFCTNNPSQTEQMHQKTQPVIEKLIELGVDRLVAEAALYLPAVINNEFLSQFEEVQNAN